MERVEGGTMLAIHHHRSVTAPPQIRASSFAGCLGSGACTKRLVRPKPACRPEGCRLMLRLGALGGRPKRLRRHIVIQRRRSMPAHVR